MCCFYYHYSKNIQMKRACKSLDFAHGDVSIQQLRRAMQLRRVPSPMTTRSTVHRNDKYIHVKNLVVLLMFVPAMCSGQKSYCKKIKKVTDINNVTVTYKSPDLSHMEAMKRFQGDVFFALHFHFIDENAHYETTGAAVEFEDGTILNDDQVNVDCKQQSSPVITGDFTGSLTHSGDYLLQGFFPINDANIKKFITRKIVRIQLDYASQMISKKEATQIINYIKMLSGM